MSQSVLIELNLPEDIARFVFPPALNDRLQSLLDKQDLQGDLSNEERREAQSLVDLSELISLLKLRVRQASKRESPDGP
jgi:hypothetical protein